jgi:sterol desaturase/sphingolipid hydroxylase (fatty acid hydroxylase superfamily)
MNKRHRYLQIALVVVGIAFLLLYPLIEIWPSGWGWQPGHSKSEQMIVGVYAILGIFLLLAAREPELHLSLIWFTVWSSAIHGLIMAVQSVTDSAERGHLFGDIPALILVAIVLGLLTPRALESMQE